MFGLTVYHTESDGQNHDDTRLEQSFTTVDAARAAARALLMTPAPTHYTITDENEVIVSEGIIHAQGTRGRQR